jgi:hypothetical protein
MSAPRALATPSPEAIAACDEFVLDEPFRDFSLIVSIATSAVEAARRGDCNEIRLRLRIQLRDLFNHAIDLHNLLSTEPKKGSGR